MVGYTKRYNFLLEDEKIEHTLSTKSGDFIVTDQRFVVIQGRDLHEEFDFKYIAHVHSESRDNQALGVITAVLGFCLIYAELSRLYGATTMGALTVIGFILFLSGIVLFTQKSTILVLTLSGVSREYKYDIQASKEEIQQLLAKISQARRRKT